VRVLAHSESQAIDVVNVDRRPKRERDALSFLPRMSVCGNGACFECVDALYDREYYIVLDLLIGILRAYLQIDTLENDFFRLRGG